MQTIQSYLQYLSIQQSQLALLSPNSQQQAMSAASAAAAVNAAAAASALLSPTGHTLVHSMTSPSSSLAASPSPSPTGNGGTPFGMASPTAGAQLQQQQLPQLPSSLNITSPSHAPISIIDPATGLPVPSQAHNGASAASTPSAAASSVDALPQSITAELDAIVIVLYGDTAAEATNKDPDPKTARESVTLLSNKVRNAALDASERRCSASSAHCLFVSSPFSPLRLCVLASGSSI